MKKVVECSVLSKYLLPKSTGALEPRAFGFRIFFLSAAN